MKKITLLALLSVLTLSSMAQNKFGYIDSQELLTLMPERVTAATEVENFAKSLQAQLGSMEAEFQQMQQEYQANESIYTDLVKQDKESEIQGLYQRIQTFEQNAQKSLQSKQNELLIPINDKLKNAINEVASEGKYTYIFTIEIFLYAEESNDIGSLVKAKLGL